MGACLIIGQEDRIPGRTLVMLPLGTRLSHPCPECGSTMVLRESRFGLFYGCQRYPSCEATHGARPNGCPLGIPADKPTKKERVLAHALFDQLWRGPQAPMSRLEAYCWMQKMMEMSSDDAHIGRFMTEDCVRLRALLRKNFPDFLQESLET